MNIQTDNVDIQSVEDSYLAHVRCILADGEEYESDIAESDIRESSVMVDQSSADDRYPDHTHVDTVRFKQLTQPAHYTSTYTEDALMRANRDVINDHVGHLAATVWDGDYLNVRLDKADAPKAIKECVELSKQLENYPVLDEEAMSEYEMKIIFDNMDMLRSHYLAEHIEAGWIEDVVSEWLDEHGLWNAGREGSIDREIERSCRNCGELYVGHSSADPLRETIYEWIDAEDRPTFRSILADMELGDVASVVPEIVLPSSEMLDLMVARADDPVVEAMRWVLSAIDSEESAEDLADDWKSDRPFPRETIRARIFD